MIKINAEITQKERNILKNAILHYMYAASYFNPELADKTKILKEKLLND